MNEKLLSHFNRVEKLHWWWQGRRELIKMLLFKKNPRRILDIGCGSGETLRYIKELFPKCEVYGVDSSLKAVKYSKSKGNKHIYRANALSLPFKDNYFDTVLFLDVLEHIKEHQKAIDEAKRVLKKGGRIYITSPSLPLIWTTFDENQGHKRRYSKHQIRELANHAKMKVEFISYFNFFLSPPIIIIRLLARIKQFRFLVDYDRGFNYDIAFKPFINSLLKELFISEINLIRYVNYPIGISIAAVLQK